MLDEPLVVPRMPTCMHHPGQTAFDNPASREHDELKAWRGVATRYDKTPDSYLAGIHLRASMIWIKDLTRTAH
ncbi:hypothetical protein [Streptomyces sp. NPDC020681]|uniref:hypothetical protein n=1 Tax=Streptomyces sp. NPDC020681 TaxID=3365083 RepID=UPI0037AD266D